MQSPYKAAGILWEEKMAICLVGMCVTLLLQGAFFFARDAATPDLPRMFIISDYCWLFMFLSLFAWKRWPIVTLLACWVGFVAIACVTQPNAKEKTIGWFFLSNSVLVSTVLLAHGNAYFAYRKAHKSVSGISQER